jgi:hypothetical protein
VKRFALLSAVLALALARAAQCAQSDDEVESHRVALGVAAAFQNAGFKLRDGVHIRRTELGKSHLVQVNLYAGNQYWFTVGASKAATKVAISLYDESGKPIECEPYAEGATAAAGFSPAVSGPYYVKIELIEGAACALCLVYSYK